MDLLRIPPGTFDGGGADGLNRLKLLVGITAYALRRGWICA